MQRSDFGSKIGLLLVLGGWGERRRGLHGPDPDPYPAREGLKCLLCFLVVGHMAMPRLEMLRTSLPLSPILALPPGDGEEGRDTPGVWPGAGDALWVPRRKE